MRATPEESYELSTCVYKGEDKAIGTAAANWVESLHQLAAYGWERLVKVDVDTRRVGDTAARRSAVRLARIAFQRRAR